MYQFLRRSINSLTSLPNLTNWISEEKDVIFVLENLKKEKNQSCMFISRFGQQEHDDLQDITDRFADITKEFDRGVTELQQGLKLYRSQLKQIKKMAEQVHSLETKYKQLSEKYNNAVKANKPTAGLEGDLKNLELELVQKTAECESMKRRVLKEAFHHHFDAWLKFSESLQLYGVYGKHFADQIPQGSLQPGEALPVYKGKQTTNRIYTDFCALVDQKQAGKTPPPPDLSNESIVIEERRPSIVQPVQSIAIQESNSHPMDRLSMEPFSDHSSSPEQGMTDEELKSRLNRLRLQ